MYCLNNEYIDEQIVLVYTEKCSLGGIETPENNFIRYRNIFLNNYLTYNSSIKTLKIDGFNRRMTDMIYSIEIDEKNNNLILNSNGVPSYIPKYVGLNCLNSFPENNLLQTLKSSNNKKGSLENNYNKNIYFISTNFKIPLNPKISSNNIDFPSGIVGVALNGVPFYNSVNHY